MTSGPSGPDDSPSPASAPPSAPASALLSAPQSAVRGSLLGRFAEALCASARAVYEALAQADDVLIALDPIPDGDAMGAALALAQVAEAARAARGAIADVVIASESPVPARYRFLPGSARVRLASTVAERTFAVAVVVDGGAERLGALEPVFARARVRAQIDHHRFGSRSTYDLRLYDPAATSTTQLLWPFFADPALAVPLDADAAEALYLGLIYDTGSFQYPCTQPVTHEIAARLMDLGLDVARVHEQALLLQSYEQVVEQGRILARAARSQDGRVIWVAARPEDLVASEGDYGRVMQTLGFVEGVEAAFVLVEKEPGRQRVSLRSRGGVDVGQAARDLDAGGGGHARAAGCELDGPAEAVAARVVALLTERLSARNAEQRAS